MLSVELLGSNFDKKRNSLIVTAYFAALLLIISFHKYFRLNCYISENALLPGYVLPEIKSTHLISDYLQALSVQEKSEIRNFIEKEIRRLGFRTNVHAYMVARPMNTMSNVSGINVYTILRARRGTHSESIVFCVPIKSSGKINRLGISYAFTFLRHASSQSYWSKDIIFLFVENENYGVHSWLHAYMNPSEGGSNLSERAGAIIAALIIDFTQSDFESVQVLFSGLNNILPNLDLVNSMIRICAHEELVCHIEASVTDTPMYTLSHQILEHATGYSRGMHAPFNAMRIESITLKGTKDKHLGMMVVRNNRLAFIRALEGEIRAINNLIERFHQSYFFYLLPTSYTFVPISYFMTPLAFLFFPLLVRLLYLWFKCDLKCYDSLKAIAFIHSLCFLIFRYRFMFYFIISWKSIFKLLWYAQYFIFFNLFLFNFKINSNFVQFYTCIALAVCVGVLSLVNISLAYLAVLTVMPFTVMNKPKHKFLLFLVRIICLAASPLTAVLILYFLYDRAAFSFTVFEEHFSKYLIDTWIFDVCTPLFVFAALLPLWILSNLRMFT